MNHLYEQLTALKLTGFRDALKKQLAQPGTYQELGFEERLSLLTAEELTCRENRKAERLIKHARFRLNAELSKLDYTLYHCIVLQQLVRAGISCRCFGRVTFIHHAE